MVGKLQVTSALLITAYLGLVFNSTREKKRNNSFSRCGICSYFRLVYHVLLPGVSMVRKCFIFLFPIFHIRSKTNTLP